MSRISLRLATFALFTLVQATYAQQARPWSYRIADSFLERHPGGVTYDSASPDVRWNYEQGLMLAALLSMWQHSGDSRYFDFVRQNIDLYVTENGEIKTYDLRTYNLDNIGPGRVLLKLYEVTGGQKYKIASDTLRQQLRYQPRTNEGGFWHKKIYPYQMWLDGLFMAEPFYAQYAKAFSDSTAFDDIANQFIWIATHTRDAKTGLLYHGWDESKQQRWADPVTGCSPNFWGRAMGWYAMALVDVLDEFPATHPKRNELVAILRDLAAALLKVRDAKTDLWFQVIDQGTTAGNYLEASASCMFVYSFAKGVARGYLDSSFASVAQRSFRGIMEHLVSVDAGGRANLHHTCRSAGLGGTPYRDGSVQYYVGEPQRTNDMKGLGPLLLAAIELERGAGGVKESHR